MLFNYWGDTTFVYLDKLSGLCAFCQSAKSNIARCCPFQHAPVWTVICRAAKFYLRLYSPGKKLLARIGIDFGLAFAVLTGINYFVQLSAVRLSLLKGELQGLEQIVQANPISGISAINMLG